MPYDKPKVTIDLDEYNDLLRSANEFTHDTFAYAAKEIIAGLFNHKSNVDNLQNYLTTKGISFSIVNRYGHVHTEDIEIHLIDSK